MQLEIVTKMYLKVVCVHSAFYVIWELFWYRYDSKPNVHRCKLVALYFYFKIKNLVHFFINFSVLMNFMQLSLIEKTLFLLVWGKGPLYSAVSTYLFAVNKIWEIFFHYCDLFSAFVMKCELRLKTGRIFYSNRYHI